MASRTTAGHGQYPALAMSADSDRAALRRSIGIVFADGGLLALSAVRPSGAGESGAALVTPPLCPPGGAPVEVSEPWPSTEYGPAGVQRPATLELWVDGEE